MERAQIVLVDTLAIVDGEPDGESRDFFNCLIIDLAFGVLLSGWRQFAKTRRQGVVSWACRVVMD